MPAQYFERCRCPRCRTKLDRVMIDTKYCPRCEEELYPEEVWKTRTYAGQIAVPWWVYPGAPLLLALTGVVVLAVGRRFEAGKFPTILGVVLIAIALMLLFPSDEGGD